MKSTMLALAAAAAMLAPVAKAAAQDVPGIEICTAEKTMERRTGCLQSNVNFLKDSLTKVSLASQQKLDAANRQIDALKVALAGLQARIETLEKKPAPSAAPAPAAK